MNRKAERGELQQLLDHTNLAVGTWAPGDGQTRYRFFPRTAPLYAPTTESEGHGIQPPPPASAHADYHAGDGLYTALGRGEAVTWLRGYRAALVNARDRDRLVAMRAELRKASGGAQ